MNDVFGNIGRLMHLPLESIEPAEENFFESEFILMSAADALLQADGRNWIPVIVKETGDYQYQVVANPFIYAVAQQANLERVWCIVIPSDEKIIEQAKLLAREIPPKINLNSASREMLMAALKYLVAKPKSILKGVDVIIAANRIAEAKDRTTWTDFSAITKLSCKITAKKVDALSEIFYLSPKPVLLPPTPAPVNLNAASEEMIMAALKYLLAKPDSQLKGVDVIEAANRISKAKDRTTWTDFSPISKLGCKITAQKVNSLSEIFYLSPKPVVLPPPPPAAINIKCASRDEIFERLKYLSTYKIGGFETVDIEKAADVIFSADKSKWKTTLNPIEKLNCGIDKKKITELKTVFNTVGTDDKPTSKPKTTTGAKSSKSGKQQTL